MASVTLEKEFNVILGSDDKSVEQPQRLLDFPAAGPQYFSTYCAAPETQRLLGSLSHAGSSLAATDVDTVPFLGPLSMAPETELCAFARLTLVV